MKTGRNDPCPCGSGKKYKKCCLAEDESKQAMAAVAPPLPQPQPAHPQSAWQPPDPVPVQPDPFNEAIDARWDAFEAADPKGRIELFHQTLDEPEMMEQLAFDMLSEIDNDAVEPEERDRFEALLALLRERLPEVYQESEVFYLAWQIENRIAMGRMGDLDALVLELAAKADKDMDVYSRVVQKLEFHGQLQLLVRADCIAWPQIKDSADVLEWAVAEYANDSIIRVVLSHMEAHPDMTGTEPELLERVRFYDEPREGWIERFVQDLLGRNTDPWTLKQFDLKAKVKKKKRRRDELDEDDDEEDGEEEASPGQRALWRLGDQFTGWLYREKGFSLTLAQQGRDEMVKYLFEQAEGELDDSRALYERMMDKRKPQHKPIHHPLCPDRDRYDLYCGRMLHLLSLRVHPCAALVEVTPPWLEFLESRGLLAAAERERMVEDLLPPVKILRDFFSKLADDPHLIRALRTWPPLPA